MESGNKQKADDIIHQYNQEAEMQEILLAEALAKLKTARIIFFVIGALQAIVGFVFYTQQPAPLNAYTLGVALVIGAIFILLGFYTMKKPTLAVTIGLVLYVALILLDVAMSPESFYRGILMRIIFIVALVKALKSAKEAEQIRRDYMQKMRQADKPIDMI